MRAAKPLGLVAIGWALACLYILGPRIAMNRGLDLGYSLAGWLGSTLLLLSLARLGLPALQIRAQRSGHRSAFLSLAISSRANVAWPRKR
jgi:hypothetical protein